MKQVAAFWDTSALIPLCIVEPSSPRARMLLRQYALVVWWGTRVEIHSSISRRYRSGNLPDASHHAALNRLNALSCDWREVLPNERLRDLAQDLLTQHNLRAADALQLAAALIWCQQRPSNRSFLSGDIRLCEAAAATGFVVERV